MKTIKKTLIGWLGLLGCFVTGKLLVLLFDFPLPSALTGLLLLLVFLVIRGEPSQSITVAVSPLLKHMSLLFVPAVLGVGLYWDDVVQHSAALIGAIFVSTIVALGLAGVAAEKILSKRIAASK
ncbi:CidA/LrgA family protein [Alteromonas sp. H39]|uniref:CidA/LrgA family protein n=1 Tax=Alteromonas sp. H39 TaxID=3389876 RepID=UPI0039DF78CD